MLKRIDTLRYSYVRLLFVPLIFLSPLSASKDKAGLEIRANAVGGSGRFMQSIHTLDGENNTGNRQNVTSDLTNKGYSLLVGYGRNYYHRGQSSLLYIGYENQKWNDKYDSIYHAFLMGIEGALGTPTVKFVYGGEFAFGALDTGIDGLGYLSTFSAEPYIGLRLLTQNAFSLNLRLGARWYAIEDVVTPNVMRSENSAFIANAQVGVGYSFY